MVSAIVHIFKETIEMGDMNMHADEACVSWVERIQMDPNSRLDTCVNEKSAPSKVVTGVVPITTSPMPKSE